MVCVCGVLREIWKNLASHLRVCVCVVLCERPEKKSSKTQILYGQYRFLQSSRTEKPEPGALTALPRRTWGAPAPRQRLTTFPDDWVGLWASNPSPIIPDPGGGGEPSRSRRPGLASPLSWVAAPGRVADAVGCSRPAIPGSELTASPADSAPRRSRTSLVHEPEPGRRGWPRPNQKRGRIARSFRERA